MEDDEYEVTDSEDEYSKEDKILLENARSIMRGKEGSSSDEEVYGFDESGSDEDVEEEEEEDDEEDEEIDMGSDIEDEEKPPDERAWGHKKKFYYNTDFVDEDYDGVYQGEEAEKAEIEEQEAKNIQKRLLEQLSDADFSIKEALDIAEVTESTTKQEVIQSDLTKLTKRQKLDLFKKESPEFFMLVNDFKEKLLDAQKFFPVIKYFKKKTKHSFPFLDFLQTKLSVILNYCTNISFYMLLKSKRIPVKNHPVMNSLLKYRKFLLEMEEVDRKIIQPQVNEILEMINSGKNVPLDGIVEEKKTLKVLSQQMREKKLLKEKQDNDMIVDDIEMKDGLGEVHDEEMTEKEEEPQEKAGEKRAITYEMAKNKGLIPKRNKVQRNPRVKHRRKYEKAKIRRRGQVRTPRSEIPVYGGEPTGIKIGLTKSIKIK